MYDSIDSFDSIQPDNAKPHKSSFFKKIRFGGKNKMLDEYILSYKNASTKGNEKAQLLSRTHRNKKYNTLVECDDDKVTRTNGKKAKKVRFCGVDNEVVDCSTKNKKKKKKYSLLKKTGKMIVHTCRLMTYGMPYLSYMPPDYPSDAQSYQYYNFETKQYEYKTHLSYMPYPV